MAEAFNSLFKAELVRNRGPWRGVDDLEIAVAEYIDVSGPVERESVRVFCMIRPDCDRTTLSVTVLAATVVSTHASWVRVTSSQISSDPTSSAASYPITRW